MVALAPLKVFQFPIIAECVSPDVFQGKTLTEIGELTVWEGNRQRRLAELFRIHEDPSENPPEGARITMQGDMSKVRRIGSKMKSGKIIIAGNAGMHLGVEMKGGTIIVHGNVGAWTGSMMKGGTIEIHGDAGDYLAAPYRGSREGMRGGSIIVHGNAGNEAGARMKGGMIKIFGCAGQFAGFRMREGVIFVGGDCAKRVGACMVNGKIIVNGFLESVLPTFTIEDIRSKVKMGEGEVAEGPFYVFLGDLVENGRGKLYVSKGKNPHLSVCETLLRGERC